jgi:membrane protein DedA with SNARE-associated domain
MLGPIEWLRTLIIHYPSFEYIIIFFGAGFGGELGLLALGFLAAQNIISIFPLVILSFLGTSFTDTLWFTLGSTKMIKGAISHRYANTTISVINEALGRFSRGNHLMALIVAKFIVGTRVLLIMYVSSTGIGFKNFIRYDIFAIIIWLVVLLPIGFLAGLGYTYLAQILQNIYAATGFILLVILVVFMLQIWLKRKLTKEKSFK